MAKLIRCPAGHVYDSQAHDECPECARTGVPRAAEDARPAQVSKAAQGVEEDSSKGGGEAKRGIPLTWLIGGGAAAALLIAAAVFLLRPSAAPVQQADPNSDPDFQACLKPSDVQAKACERAITSGKFSGNALSSLYNNRGIGHQKKKELDAAISDFAEAIKLNGRNAFAFNNRGNAYRNQRKNDSALEDFAKAIEIDAKYISPYNNRGLLYLDKGEFDRAIADFDQVLQIDANYLRTYWNRGSAYLKKGERERAIADYKKALSLNPDDSTRKMIEAELNEATAQPAPQAATPNQTPASAPGPSAQTSAADPKTDPDYGACEKASGDSRIAACDRAIASGKFAGTDLGALYRYLAFAKSHAEKPDLNAVIADYSEAVRLEPNSFIPLILRANVYADKGEQELAIKDYDRAIELNPRADFYNNRGNALRKSGKVDRAIADLDQAIKLDPNYFGAYWNRGLAYQDKGDKEKAADDYKKALSLNPDDATKKKIESALSALGSASASAAAPAATTDGGGTQPAPTATPQVAGAASDSQKSGPDYQACTKADESTIEVCDKAITSGKFSGTALASLYIGRGADQAAMKNYDAAISDLSEAIKLDPNRVAAFSNRGAVFRMKGDRDKAIEDLDQAIKLNPKFSSAFNNRGLVYADKRDYDRAIQDYNQAIALDPNHLKSYKNRGDAYRRKGEKELATADYQKALSLNPSDDVKKQINAALYALGSAPPATPAPAIPAPATEAQTAEGQSQAPSSGTTSPETTSPKAEPATSSADPNSDPDYQACEKFIESGAAEACSRAIASGKFGGNDLAQLYAYRGGIALFKNEDAVADFSEAVRINPSSTNLSNLGVAYMEKGDYDKALQNFDQAIALDAKGASAFRNRGIAHSGKGDYGRAIEDFGQAIKLEPNEPILYKLRADAYAKKGDREHATEDYNKALSLKPAESAKAEIETSLKQLESGIPSSASGSAPVNAPAQSADANKGQAKYANSSLTAKDFAAATKDPDFKSCYDFKEVEQVESCDRAIHSGKFSGPALSGLYVNKGLLTSDPDIAFSAYDQATQLDPKNVYAFNGRAGIYLGKGKNDLAIEEYNTAVGLNPKRAATYVLRAAAFDRAGDNARAMEDFEKAIELDPRHAETYESRGAFLMRKKDLDGAKKDFDQAISLDPKSTTAMNLRAGYYREMKEYDLALKDLDEIVRLEPNNVTGYFNRGKFYMDRKDKEHAIADLNKASTLDVERRYKVPISGMLRRLEMMD